jgi:hypothetical protein
MTLRLELNLVVSRTVLLRKCFLYPNLKSENLHCASLAVAVSEAHPSERRQA